jgi:hypothetical protein
VGDTTASMAAGIQNVLPDAGLYRRCAGLSVRRKAVGTPRPTSHRGAPFFVWTTSPYKPAQTLEVRKWSSGLSKTIWRAL